MKDKLNPNAAILVNTLKSKNLHQLGRGTEAYELLKNISLKKDSIDNRFISSQMTELQTIYEIHKMETDMEIQAIQLERTKIIVIALLVTSLLLLILIITTRKNKKEKEKKNKNIYEQYQLMKSFLNKIRSQREELDMSKQNETDESINWTERAYCYLINTEAFKNEDLSRNDLATALGTNRQYLIDSIKAETGKTFRDYINTIRIEYAYEMLIRDWNASIESIYMTAGFTTRSTFNRLFKDQYGMSPIEMREIAKKKEQHIMTQIEDID